MSNKNDNECLACFILALLLMAIMISVIATVIARTGDLYTMAIILGVLCILGLIFSFLYLIITCFSSLKE